MKFISPIHIVTGATLLVWFTASSSTPSPQAGTGIEEPEISLKQRNHWAFRPLIRPAMPSVTNEQQVRNTIDRFVLQELESRGLALMPAAGRRVLIRRLSYDLTGLPPTSDEIARFLNDDSPSAYPRLVDQLLASPAYGERWAQHWLDLARFAETDGFEHDKIRPDAWRYRDWVIRALNADLPYDRFVQLQIAGDELYPDDPDAAIATGFLLSGPDMPDINDQRERRHTVLNEITSTVGKSLLGLGLGCAQCHDHKYDPVSQADFYRMRAFFENSVHPKRDRQLGHRITEPGPQAPVSYLMIRGDFRRPGPELQPAFLPIARPGSNSLPVQSQNGNTTSSGRRTMLAKWLTGTDQALGLRVIANRLWQHHLGAPLVGTPNDFGFQGDKPTHPKLLDWLATEIPRRGWSLKAMHRLILNSATYRQASFGEGSEWEGALTRDPENRFLSRMNRTRLEGETLRDAMLSVSGALNRETGGPGVRPRLSPEITVTLLKNQWQVSTNEADHFRRSIYLFARRNMRYPMFDVFDRPDANASCARRHESTTAPQSLTLLNSKFSLEMARRLAGFATREAGMSVNDRVGFCFEQTLGRPATAHEKSQSLEFISRQAQLLEADNRSVASLATPVPAVSGSNAYQEAAFIDFCLALFNLSEFIYVD